MVITLMAAALATQAVPNAETQPEAVKVCRTERSLGTRVVKRVCKTQAEMAMDAAAAKAALTARRNREPPPAFLGPKGQ